MVVFIEIDLKQAASISIPATRRPGKKIKLNGRRQRSSHVGSAQEIKWGSAVALLGEGASRWSAGPLGSRGGCQGVTPAAGRRAVHRLREEGREPRRCAGGGNWGGAQGGAARGAGLNGNGCRDKDLPDFFLSGRDAIGSIHWI
jgi:hypothetical protein